MTQPIQAVQIYYEHPFGAEREVLREFFSFVGCLVKTTMMPVETILEKHKSLVNPGSERITHLFLTDRLPEGIVLSKNEIWCSFRILKRELAINGKEILHNADQKISAEQFEKTTLDVIIRRIWKDDEAATQSLLHINASFWQLDLFEFLQIKSTFQALKMGELMALPMRGHYYLPEAVYLNKMADTFINMAKQCSVGPSSIYAVYAYVNAQRHLRELLASLETHALLRTKLYAAVEPVQKLLSGLNKIYRIEPNFVSMYCLAAALCEGQAQFALDARPPDFYSDKYKIMMDVMKVEDNTRKTKKGSLRNPKAVKEREIYNLFTRFGKFPLEKANPSVDITINEPTGLPTKEDHRFEWYYNNFTRVLNEHNKKIPLYKKNHEGYATVFFVFDESTAYAQFPTEQDYTKYIDMQIGQKVENTIIHFAHYDEKFQNVIKSIDADYIIWYAPYKIFCGYTENGKLANQPLPQTVIIDVKALKQGNITCDHYVESLMVSAEG